MLLRRFIHKDMPNRNRPNENNAKPKIFHLYIVTLQMKISKYNQGTHLEQPQHNTKKLITSKL